MDGMAKAKHARPAGWNALLIALITAAVILSPAFFIVMFRTVTALVRPSFGIWAWTVPVATEGSFLILYGLDILLEWARKPKGWLRWTPYPFAAASLALNVWAYLGSPPGMIGHAVITVAFFIPVIAAESAVRDLAVSGEELALRAAVADARQYAADLCRDRRGRMWRWRVPVLLRTQVLTGRLPDEVTQAITALLAEDRTSGWQAAVRGWVLGADGLALSVQADVSSRRVTEDITGELPAVSPAPLPAPPAGAAPSPVPAPRPGRVPVPAVRRAQRLGRKATDDDIMDAMREMAAEGREPTRTRVVKELPVGHERAGVLIARWKAEQPVPIGRAAAR